MKGLLIKDMHLLKDNRMLVAVIFAIAILFMFTRADASMIVSFITLIMTMLVVSSISYDDFDQSNSFLMTLPITRDLYVKEKYVLGMLLAGSGWISSSILASVFQIMSNTKVDVGEWGTTLFVLLMVAILSMAIMIPIQLKFGGDKGRIAMIGFVLFAFLIGGGVIAICNYANIDLNKLLTSIIQIDRIYILLITFLLVLMCLFVSYKTALHVMRKKQF